MGEVETLRAGSGGKLAGEASGALARGRRRLWCFGQLRDALLWTLGRKDRKRDACRGGVLKETVSQARPMAPCRVPCLPGGRLLFFMLCEEALLYTPSAKALRLPSIRSSGGWEGDTQSSSSTQKHSLGEDFFSNIYQKTLGRSDMVIRIIPLSFSARLRQE